MARFEVKSRRITVDQTLYTYSVAQKREGIQLLVYRDKRPFLRLEQDWTEAWGINLYRPGVVARIIRHYRQGERRRSRCSSAGNRNCSRCLWNFALPRRNRRKKSGFYNAAQGYRRGQHRKIKEK